MKIAGFGPLIGHVDGIFDSILEVNYFSFCTPNRSSTFLLMSLLFSESRGK